MFALMPNDQFYFAPETFELQLNYINIYLDRSNTKFKFLISFFIAPIIFFPPTFPYCSEMTFLKLLRYFVNMYVRMFVHEN